MVVPPIGLRPLPPKGEASCFRCHRNAALLPPPIGGGGSRRSPARRLTVGDSRESVSSPGRTALRSCLPPAQGGGGTGRGVVLCLFPLSALGHFPPRGKQAASAAIKPPRSRLPPLALVFCFRPYRRPPGLRCGAKSLGPHRSGLRRRKPAPDKESAWGGFASDSEFAPRHSFKLSTKCRQLETGVLQNTRITRKGGTRPS